MIAPLSRTRTPVLLALTFGWSACRGVGTASTATSDAALSTAPKYYLVIFAAQSESVGISPNTHNFASFIRLGAGQAALPVERLPAVEAEAASAAFTISWMPTTLPICVTCMDAFPGRNWSLPATLLAERQSGNRVSSWGPFEIQASLYTMALKQYRHLASGTVRYALWDKNTRPQAINCIHALSDLDTTKSPFIIGAKLGNVESEALVERFHGYFRSNARKELPVATWLGIEDFKVYNLSP